MPQDLPGEADEVGSPASGLRVTFTRPITAADLTRLLGDPLAPVPADQEDQP